MERQTGEIRAETQYRQDGIPRNRRADRRHNQSRRSASPKDRTLQIPRLKTRERWSHQKRSRIENRSHMVEMEVNNRSHVRQKDQRQTQRQTVQSSDPPRRPLRLRNLADTRRSRKKARDNGDANAPMVARPHTVGHVKNETILKRTNVAPIKDKMRQSRLRWYGHVLRADREAICRSPETVQVPGSRPRGRPKLRYSDTLSRDMEAVGLRPSLAQNREVWRRKSQRADPLSG